MSRRGLLAAAAVVVVAVVAVLLWRSPWAAPSASSVGPPVGIVRPDVPDHQLLQDALQIVATRRSQDAANFTAMPVTRPPQLARMLIGGGGEAILDTYHLTSGLIVIVAFSTDRLNLCAVENADVPCVRDEELPDMAQETKAVVGDRTQEGAGGLRHLTVYFSYSDRPVTEHDPSVAEARRYWSTVDLVPAVQALWFTQLVDVATTSTVPS